jgi:magnesium chelatase accessory protein
MIPPHDPIRRAPTGANAEEKRRVQAGGVHWHVRARGSGSPRVLLLHGSASSGHAWDEVSRQLVTLGFSTLAPDLPGHGESEGVPGGGALTPDALGRALGALLRALDAAPDLVVGHSVGAVLAIRAATLSAVTPCGILGVNPALGTRQDHIPSFLEEPTARMARHPTPARMLSAIFRHLPLAEVLLRSTGSRIPESAVKHYRALLSDPRRVAGVLRLQADWDAAGIGAEARRLIAEVRFMTGAQDRWVPRALLERERAGVPLEVLPDRGHLLPEEDPDAVVRSILTLADAQGLRPLHEAPFEPPERDPQ